MNRTDSNPSRHRFRCAGCCGRYRSPTLPSTDRPGRRSLLQPPQAMVAVELDEPGDRDMHDVRLGRNRPQSSDRDRALVIFGTRLPANRVSVFHCISDISATDTPRRILQLDENAEHNQFPQRLPFSSTVREIRARSSCVVVLPMPLVPSPTAYRRWRRSASRSLGQTRNEHREYDLGVT